MIECRKESVEKYTFYLKALRFLTLGVVGILIGGVLLVFVAIPQVLQNSSFHRFIEKKIHKKALLQVHIEKMAWKTFKSLVVHGTTVVQWGRED